MAYKQHFEDEYKAILFGKIEAFLKKEGHIFTSFEEMIEQFMYFHEMEVGPKTFKEWLDGLGFKTRKVIIIEHEAINNFEIEDVIPNNTEPLQAPSRITTPVRHPQNNFAEEVDVLLDGFSFDNEQEKETK